MNLKRTTIIFVGGAAFAAWLSAAITPGRPPAPVEVIAPAPVDASGAALAGEIARLRERLRPDPAPERADAQSVCISIHSTRRAGLAVPGPAANDAGRRRRGR